VISTNGHQHFLQNIEVIPISIAIIVGKPPVDIGK
jgi:hypothetical protein